MFVLRTGLQGHTKTLNTIIELDVKAAAEGRTVYYHNITNFKPDHPAIQAQWVHFDDPTKWFELPPNALIVIDEAQSWFRVRPQGSKVPDYASRLEIMRKDGHELHCITQSPKIIDGHMRELCNSHIHYYRGGKGKVIKRWEFEKPEPSVNGNKLEFENGQSTRILLNSKYFGVYDSVKEGTGHHFKFKPPRALFVLVIACIFIAIGSYRIYTKRIALPDPVADPVAAAVGQPAIAAVGTPVNSSGQVVITPEQYVDMRIPRVADVPSSAPIYDKLTEPVSYPKPFCVSTGNEEMARRNALKMTLGYRGEKLHGCRCNSQQGTRLDISFNACMAYVENGAFDPAKPDSVSQQGGRGVGVAEGRGTTTTRTPGVDPQRALADRAQQGVQFTHIPDNSRLPRTLY